MSNLSKPKRAAVILIIIAVLMVPVYLAYNDQGVQDALSAMSANNGSGFLEDHTVGHARYNEDAGEQQTGQAETTPESIDPARITHPDETVVIETVMTSPTPTPEPSPPAKWEPAFPATDGELIIDGLVEEDSINILIVGIDRSANLADTVGVVSVSGEKQTIRLIMFPRDLFVGYSDTVLENMEKIRQHKLPGVYKINNAINVAKNTEKYTENITFNDNRFENNSFDFLAQVIYEKFDIWIDDFVRINTFGFVRLVDLFGGVRVYVPISMHYDDPGQNLSIHISKGSQLLNGTQAEGFVRFRQGYDSSGELRVSTDRTKNQIAFLKAFYEQHAKLSNVNKIPAVLDTLKRYLIHSISADDVFTKYIDVGTAIVRDSYAFESIDFELDYRRYNGALYMTIESAILPSDQE